MLPKHADSGISDGYNSDMKSRVRLAKAAAIAVASALLLGPLIAVAAAAAIRAARDWCDPSSAHYVCPDGIGYIIPGLTVVSFTGLVVLIVASWLQFRGVDENERHRFSGHIAVWTASVVALFAFTDVGLFFVNVDDLLPTASGGMVASIWVFFGSIATILAQWIGPTTAFLSCVCLAVVLVAVSAVSFVFLPFSLIPAAFLLVAAEVRVPVLKALRRR